MTKSLCSRCKLLGKPRARINFIIATGLPNSLVYHRLQNLLRNYSKTSFENDARLTNYGTLIDISDQLFNHQNNSSSIDQSISSAIQACCHGFTTMPIDIDDISNSSQLETFQKDILHLLRSKADSATEKQNIKPKSASWILMGGSICLEPALLNVFLQISDQNSLLLSFTLTVLCFFPTEQLFLESWFFQDLPIQDDHSNTNPKYQHGINNFFSLLNSSEYLQQNTLLINEEDVLTDDKLQILLKDISRNRSSKFRANNNKFRCDITKLFFLHQHKMRNVLNVRDSLQKCYNETIENRLTVLLNDLQQTTTAVLAARKISRLVLDEFERMNEEEQEVYIRKLILGFKSNNAKHSNTIAAQLARYALHLLKNNDDISAPLIYSIILVICRLGDHFIFRHELFNNTPEIYTLSLLLVIQRHYALTLSGLRLCITILNSDQNEYKYAMAYLIYDPLSARKILDAIKWLLSPYLTLKNLWKEEKEKKNDDCGSNKEESPLYIAEKFCFRHANILLERSYISGLASLFYGSTDHCALVTEDDIHYFTEVINILADPWMARWSRGEKKSLTSLMLINDICTLLTPILLYNLPLVSLALLNEDHLLIAVRRTILTLLETEGTYKTMADTCIRLYTQLVQSRCNQQKLDDDTDDEEKIGQCDKKTNENGIGSSAPLNLSQDLIASYSDLYRQIQKTSLLDEKSAQQEQIQALLKEKLSQLKDKLQRTQSENDNVRKKNIQMTQEIDNLKVVPTTSVTIESQHSSNLVSAGNNNQKDIINELKNLSPNEITKEQAEQFIREIYRRRTTFNDHDMRKSICGSLKHLGSDLYSSPVHFLHELIQNAEDNFYDNEVIPCLRIELNHSYILLSNNEQGLRAQDVLAICSLAVSTKTIEQEHLGEKGVGFKSIFAASDQPMLISHAWKFCFHVPGSDAMSCITPLWVKDQDIPDCISNQVLTHSQDTHLYLPLKLQIYTPEAELFLNQVVAAADPCILLNMNHLKKLEIIDKRQNKVTIIEKQLIGPTKLEEQSSVTFEDFSFINLNGSLIKLCTSSGYNTFRVYTCYIDVPNSIAQRQFQRTRLILAFPCENDYCLTSTVYSGLPVCDLGFNFLFNADFHLVTSRENVRENVPFNTFIRDHLAALFVYLLLNDIDLRKDINRYCPSTNIHQLKHSLWWLVMVDNINMLITKYLSVLFGIETGKALRHFNRDLASLVSNEQLYTCADIQVIESDDGFLTAERLKSFQIQSVSIKDVLNCFPNQEETTSTNEFRQQFRQWTKNQDVQWWSHLFHHMNQTMTSEVSNIMIQKPIFLLKNDHQREYLPTSDNTPLLLFISDDPSFRMWKRQLTLLQYSSESERIALLKSNHVQLLTEERMIEIILHDHLQIPVSSFVNNTDVKLIKEIWKDLFYLKSHLDKLNKSSPFLVPVSGIPNFAPIQNAILPTILGTDIRSFMHPTTLPIICFPYHNTHRRQLIEILQWEHFLLEMNCQRPSIYLPLDYSITKLPLLPSFTMFTDEKCARLGELILAAQTGNTKDCLRQFPITDDSKTEQQISPVSATFDEIIVRDLPSLPHITIPSHCRALAINLGVCVEYDLRTCVTILQLLSDKKNTNVDLYIQWLRLLQLYPRQQLDEFNAQSVLLSCQLYLPDQQTFYPLKDLLVISDNEDRLNCILLVSKYLKLQLISPSINQIYWQFKDLFRLLGCTCEVTIDHIYNTIYEASHDENNFSPFGDSTRTLTENGMETMIILFQHLEDLIVKCVKENSENNDLYHAIVENRHPKAPCGSREDLEWRFTFTSNSLSQQLKKLTGIQYQQNEISLLTIDRQLIRKTTENSVYACLETKIIQNLSKDISERYFISPLLARTCPLVLATFQVDYVERHGKIEWIHTNDNLEYYLTELTQIFRAALDDPELEVITSKYATVNLLFSNSFLIDSINQQNKDEIDRYPLHSNYPFWIFNKTVLLCTGYRKRDALIVIIAASALTTLFHKRKHIPFEEAMSIAQQKISECTMFHSNHIAHVGVAESSIYSYIDLLFPTDQHSIQSITISIGKYCTARRYLEDDITTTTVPVDQFAEDRIHRSQVQLQNLVPRSDNRGKRWINPSIVNVVKQIRIDHNAQHFFFTYLRRHYGSVDKISTKNWRSSSHLVTYPQHQHHVNDLAGFDFQLDDRRGVFVHGSGSTTKLYYFEVKGTSGSFIEARFPFHMARNEFNICQTIANVETRREPEPYFLVIIESRVDSEKITLGSIIDWAPNFDMINRIVDSYPCRIVSPFFINIDNWKIKQATDNRKHQKNSKHQPKNSSDRNKNSMVQSIPTSSDNSLSTLNNLPPPANQQQQQSMESNDKNNILIAQSVPTSNDNSTSTQNEHQQPSAEPNDKNNNAIVQSTPTSSDNSPSTQNEHQQQAMDPNDKNNNSTLQSIATTNENSPSTRNNPPPRQNEQQQQSLEISNKNNKSTVQSIPTSNYKSASFPPISPYLQKRKDQKSMSSNDRNNSSMVQSIFTNGDNSASLPNDLPSRQNQQQQSMDSDDRNSNSMAQSVPISTDNSASSPSISSHRQNRQQHESRSSEDRNNTSALQPVPSSSNNSVFTHYILPPRQNQQRQHSIEPNAKNNNSMAQYVATKGDKPGSPPNNLAPYQNEQQQQSTGPNDTNNNSMVQSVLTSGHTSASTLNNLPSRQNEQQQQSMRSNDRNNSPRAQSVPPNGGNSAPTRSILIRRQNVQQQQSMGPNAKNKNARVHFVPTSRNDSESTRYTLLHRENEQEQQSMNPNNKNNNSMVQSVPTSSDNSTVTPYIPSKRNNQLQKQSMGPNTKNKNSKVQFILRTSDNPWSTRYALLRREDEQQQQSMGSNDKNNNSMVQSVSTSSDNSSATPYIPPDRKDQLQQESMNSNDKNNSSRVQSVPPNGENSTSTHSKAPPYQNRQRQSRVFYRSHRINNGHYEQTRKKQ